jgi:hypothetical protein
MNILDQAASIPADYMFAYACAGKTRMLSETQHRKCSTHPASSVRVRWAQRSDLTSEQILAALDHEPDAHVRALLLSKNALSGTDAMWRAHGSDWNTQVAVAMRNDVDETIALQILDSLPKELRSVVHYAHLEKARRQEGFTSRTVGTAVAQILIAYYPELYEGTEEVILNGNWAWDSDQEEATTANGTAVNPYALWLAVPACDIVRNSMYQIALEPLVDIYPDGLSEQIAVLSAGNSKCFFEVVRAVAKLYDDESLRDHLRNCQQLSAEELATGVEYYQNMPF